MPASQIKKYEFLYRRTKGDADKLPWAHKEPTKFLSDIMQQRAPGRALDVGCGSGVDSVYLAKQGWDVTSVDLVDEPLRMTGERAERESVSLNIVQADVVQWPNQDHYDLIVDAGVLHNLPKPYRAPYRRRLLDWLKPDGDFVLVHHMKRRAMDWAPIGPHRVPRKEIRDFFSPELEEQKFDVVQFTGLPIIVGGSLAQAYYWFRRPRIRDESSQ